MRAVKDHGPVVHASSEMVAPPAAALPQRSPRDHARRHVVAVAEAVLPEEVLQACILLGSPRQRQPNAEDRSCQGHRGGAHGKSAHARLLARLLRRGRVEGWLAALGALACRRQRAWEEQRGEAEQQEISSRERKKARTGSRDPGRRKRGQRSQVMCQIQKENAK